MHVAVEQDLPHVVEAFYAAIQANSVARSVFADDAQVERLRVSLRGWLERVFTGPWDNDYALRRLRIGKIHVKVGLPQRFMMTSMSVVRQELEVALDKRVADPSIRSRARLALAKILDVDLALMLETYRDDSLAALQRVDEIERRVLANELLVSEERYRAVLETAEVIAFAIDTDQNVRLFNNHAETATGFKRTEMLTLSDIQSLWHSSDALEFQSVLARAFAGEGVAPYEARINSRSQKTHVIRWHVACLPSAKNAEACFIGVDLTRERDLDRRRKRAEELATLGTLAAGLAHEIRNPLNAAQLQLTVAERRIDRNQAVRGLAREPISMVREELGRLTTLVQDFLAYARPTPLRLSVIDLYTSCKQVVDLLAPEAQGRGVDVSMNRGDAVAARCDQAQCRQVLLNLVRNAIEAAASGGSRVHLAVRKDGPSAFLTISDDGPGFPDSVDVFEPFLTTKESGTGLGLSIVKRIIDQHEGEISIQRNDGWTNVEVEIPVTRADD